MKLCPSCKNECVNEAKFCHNCGAKLSPDSISEFKDQTRNESAQAANTISDSLNKLMPKAYVDKLMNSRGKVEGERRVVTILFSDVKGSTSLAENLDPEDVLEIMNGAFEMLIEPINRYGGTLARLMGDAILAFFGAPIAHEDDPYLACRAALDILEGAKIYSKKIEKERGIKGFAVRVGINTGLVVVAEVGADLRVEYTAMGDAVNIAARMESAAEPNTILITEATKKLIQNKFDVKSLGPVLVKGKLKPLNVYRVMNVKADNYKPVSSDSIRSRLIGRESELLEFEKTLNLLENGSGKIISVISDQGVGKSRIVAEARRSSPKNIRWIEGRAYEYTQKDSYWIARDLLNNLFQVNQNSLLVEPKDKLKAFMTMLEKDKFSDIYPLLAHFLNIPIEENLNKTIKWDDAETLKGQIHYANKEFIRNEALNQPLVLVFEDLHWADSASLELLDELLSLVEEAPILFVLVYRKNQGEIWKMHNNYLRVLNNYYSTLHLECLSNNESLLLLHNLMNEIDLPKKIRNQIIEKTEGNPFFMEEVVLSFIDRGIINPVDGKLDTDIIDNEFQIPNLLHSVIVSRVDCLPAIDKLTLQTASVIGKKISKQLLTEMMHDDIYPDEFDKELEVLQRKEFIFQHIPDKTNPDLFSYNSDYIFKSSLTQDVVYDTLLLSHRKRIHKNVGDAIEKLFTKNKNDYASTLAYHYEKGSLFDKSIHYYKIAGNRSKEVFANDEAIYSYLKALELSEKNKPKISELISIHEALGDVYSLTSDYQSAIVQYKEILNYDIGSHTYSIIYYKCGQVYERWGMYDEAFEYYNKSLEKLDETEEGKQAALAYAGIGMVSYRRDEIDTAIDMNLKALKILKQEVDEIEIADVYNNLGIIYCKAGSLDKALDYHKNCFSIRKKLNNLSGLAASYNNLGYLYHQQELYDKAVESYKKSLEICEKTGNLHGLAMIYDNISHVYLNQGKDKIAQEFNIKAIVALGKVALRGNEVKHDIWLQSGVW